MASENRQPGHTAMAKVLSSNKLICLALIVSKIAERAGCASGLSIPALGPAFFCAGCAKEQA